MAARVAVMTVTWNSAAVLPDFLRSLAGQREADWHLFAVDNASADNTVAQLREFAVHHKGKVSVTENAHNVGAAEGNNQAMRAALAAGFDLLLFINNDVVFGQDLLTQLAGGMQAQECDIACPRIVDAGRPQILWAAGGEFQPLAGYRTVHYGFNQPDRAEYDRPRRITYAPTTCLLVTRSAVQRVGLLDPAYFAYSEDADWMWRALRAGTRACYVPEARLEHKVSSLAGHASEFSDHYGTRNRVYFLRKNIGGVRAAFWAGVYWLYCVARRVARRDSAQRFRVKMRGWREGWRMPMPRQGGGTARRQFNEKFRP